MPEGDTIFVAARTLHRALAGQRVVRFEHAVPHFAFVELAGRCIEAVDAQGKHLLMHLDGGDLLETHLRMRGAWHLYRPGERWRRPWAEMRLALHTAPFTAVCFAAPRVKLWSADDWARQGPRLGPDLIAEECDLASIARAMKSQGITSHDLQLGEALLQQSLVAGIGNVYKCEALFLERLHPFRPVAVTAEGDLEALLRTAQRLLRRNLLGGARRTTQALWPERTWVYGRAGQACRRCGALIRRARGRDDGRDDGRGTARHVTGSPVTRSAVTAGRITDFCATCQGAPIRPVSRKIPPP